MSLENRVILLNLRDFWSRLVVLHTRELPFMIDNHYSVHSIFELYDQLMSARTFTLAMHKIFMRAQLISLFLLGFVFGFWVFPNWVKVGL